LRNDDATSIDYLERVNMAIDHVVSHLDGSLRLEDVAQAAAFSPFHFHRIFRAIMGETLHHFVKRLRVERALKFMTHTPERSLTDIALACGFASSSDFSRAFKQRYGMPPSLFDVNTWRAQGRGQLEQIVELSPEHQHLQRLPAGENPDGFDVVLRELPPRTVAYIRVLQPYRPDVVHDAVNRLMSWATARGQADGQWLGYMWDDPEVTALEDCRYDTAVEVDDVLPEGEIGRYEFPAMTVAQVSMRGDVELELRILQWLFGTWLPASGFQPDDQPCFESFVGRPFAHGTESFELDVQLPVRRA